MKYFLAFLCTSIFYSPAFSQEPLKSYTTTRITNIPPKIDGLANDEAWDLVEWGGGNFTQIQPDNGKAPTEQTYFKILYDDKNLYVVIRCEDSEPGKIVQRMSRRDGFDGDWVEINIDSYYDKRTAFSFNASVSGVKGDEYISNNGDEWDKSWDPIWDLKTSINEKGWVAEFRIPLSQLRFGNKEEHIWGLQFTRRFFRNNERSTWQFIPSDASGWVHLFAELHGIEGIKQQKQLEIQPYIVAKTEKYEKQEGNPFATGHESDIDVGIDAKIGITSDVTLDLTINPDFGQVEADPSQVNLSAFQLFFQERRPFFIEGNNILTFPVTGFNHNNLFYSRRIGRQPQGWVNTDKQTGDDGVNEYVKSTSNTRILGAAKVTGKNKKGFSFGVLESVTALEKATIDSLSYEREEAIEPLTNYFVARVQQDIEQGKTIIGGMITATNRNIHDPQLNHLHTAAYSGGVDLTHYWKDRSYYINTKLMVSNVQGSTEAITNTQLSPERFFQRPDNEHTEFNASRTAFTGTGGTAVIGKKSGQLTYDAGFTWSSPQLELNDIGFLSQTDVMTQWVWAQYKTLNPFWIFRQLQAGAVKFYQWDFGWNNLSDGLEVFTNMEFKNFWSFSTGALYSGQQISNADLRGGPSITYPGGVNYWFFIGTDNRKKVRLSLNSWNEKGFEDYKQSNGLSMEIRYRPTNALNVSLNPRISKNRHALQYVKNIENEKIIVADINQTTYNLSFRMTYMITSDLSIQYWGQPFASSGNYSQFKRITKPDAEIYENRFKDLQSFIIYNEEHDLYSVDENSDAVTDYAFGNPDFNFTQFRSNMVLRWEYIPGSTFFLVWTQNRTEFPLNTDHSFSHLYNGLFDKKPHNIFLLKFTYRFVL